MKSTKTKTKVKNTKNNRIINALHLLEVQLAVVKVRDAYRVALEATGQLPIETRNQLIDLYCDWNDGTKDPAYAALTAIDEWLEGGRI